MQQTSDQARPVAWGRRHNLVPASAAILGLALMIAVARGLRNQEVV